ncbi:glycosyltransferase [uncultured Prochlorococcus sp.]|uniref:glycosyltransferase n=1 Tax=uncultured Prochlorococcus sp. TaxID=159733 RepID=UPI0025905523|nr:glycosyltransferase [uncultured Prochlorococcus sp.]
MKTITILLSNSLDRPVIRNRIIPIIEKSIEKKYKIKIISNDDKKLDNNYTKLEHISYKMPFNIPKNFIARGFMELFYTKYVLKKVYKIKSDILIITIPSIFNLIFCKKFKGKQKQVLDIRDLTWEYLEDKFIIQRSIKLFFRKVFKNKINYFDAISCSNKYEYKYIKNLYKNQCNIFLYSNGISQKQFNELNEIKEDDNKYEKISISYIGNLGIAQNLETFIKVSKLWPNIRFNIIGEGKDFKRLLKLSKGCENLSFFGKLGWSEIKSIYKKTNILYAQLSKNFSGAVPSKLYEYLATGKFIIYGGSGEAEKVLKDFNNNFVISPDNASELNKALEKIIEEKLYKNFSEKNKEKIESNYIRDKNIENLFKYINSN